MIVTPLWVLLLHVAGSVYAADCFTNQARPQGAPTGDQVASALSKQLDCVCSGNWGVNDVQELANTFVHGEMLYSVARTDRNQIFRYCKDAFNDIISQCITHGNYYGGRWSDAGETYNITNQAFPSNPLLPSDDGGPANSTTASVATTSLETISVVTTSADTTPANTTSINTTTVDTTSIKTASVETTPADTTSIDMTPVEATSIDTTPINTTPIGTTSALPPTTPTITPAPTSSVEQGHFVTTTTSIAGLSANSQTTTSANGHPTVLPIWLVSPGVGIILIPGADVIAGGIIPPPPGFPTLSPNPDGDVETLSTPSTDPSSTTATTTSTTCSSCDSCILSSALPTEITNPLPNDGDPDLPSIDPALWTSFDASSLPTTTATSASSTSLSPSTIPMALPTQPAKPIDKPDCTDAADGVSDAYRKISFPDWFKTDDGKDNDVDQLLYLLRQNVCDGSCRVPDNINHKYVVIWQQDDQCEISLGLTSDIELWIYRATQVTDNTTPDFEIIRQECWDSTDNIIKKCVNNSPNKGWWNGDHQYQYYEGGLRPLNDPSGRRGGQNPINNYIVDNTAGLTCDRCVGSIQNPDWCLQNNCPQVRRKRESRNPSEIYAGSPTHMHDRRARERVTAIAANCPLLYNIPSYPGSGQANDLPIWDESSTEQGHGCNNPLIVELDARVRGHKYATEHVFEKHWIKRFFFFLVGGQQVFDTIPAGAIGQGAITSCKRLNAVFGTPGGAQSPFAGKTAAQVIAEQVSCSGTGCPDNSRRSEFVLLHSQTNGMKNLIFTGYYTNERFASENSDRLPRCKLDQSPDGMRLQIIRAALAMQYMRQPSIEQIFKKVNDRMIATLRQLDADALGSQTPPDNLRDYSREGAPNTWEQAYREFMARLLQDSERKMQQWQADCIETYKEKVDGLEPTDRDEALKLISDYQGGLDVMSQYAMSLGPGYDDVRGESPIV